MLKVLKNYISETHAATALEYGLIVAGIALAIAGVFAIMGDDVVTVFNAIGDALSDKLSAL